MISAMPKIRRHMRSLAKDRNAVALTEFAFSLPIFMFLGLGGLETTSYTIAYLRVSQLAVTLADNASRFKEEINGNVTVLREYDINQGFKGAEKQAEGMDFEANGRMILSSLEYDSTLKKQIIRWQRCWGKASYNSSYGVQGEIVAGMGPASNRITNTESGEAIMFAEVVYNYQPIAFGEFLPNRPIRKVKAMYVRDDRALGGQPSNTANVPKSTCT